MLELIVLTLAVMSCGVGMAHLQSRVLKLEAQVHYLLAAREGGES